MPQPNHISALGVPDADTLPDDLKLVWEKCIEKLGFIPNVYSTLSLKPQRLRDFMQIKQGALARSGPSSNEIVLSRRTWRMIMVMHRLKYRLDVLRRRFWF